MPRAGALQSGVTPLHRAAEVNSCQVAQVLINADASVNVRTSWGWYAPLHFALKRRVKKDIRSIRPHPRVEF
ncbi:conserved unknown protein [Ectocarpus siliculosus]|uniref:Uncharacterized protein n=1 Tax=Ectocarpus siliculosus TaxID=2880 RepID=D7G4B2_ECTSI|nr:conserved unknown protein [Ectocarpus siliculosus]|eukprot:CBJ27127.1 conserved unknown protein [Ectocarpus siliculosus]